MHKIFKSISLRDQPVVIAVCDPELCCTEAENLPNEKEEIESLLVKTQRECEKQITQAKAQADEIVANALSEGEKIKEEARALGHNEGKETGYQAGYELGYNEGIKVAETKIREELQAEISQSALKASDVLAMAQQDAKKMILEAEGDILQLVLAITQKILARETEENPVMVLPIVRAALEKVRDQQEVIVRVNSYDFELVMQARHDLQTMVGREQPILVQSDDSVSVGNCLIDTTSGTVDARID
ncbi:MAG: FliH/SctL family protein, partial [Sporomusaceae bacterium]|nr:FliH/SctL family protein [Sporomusaceae bacterium]